MKTAEDYARTFHNIYEGLAPEYQYITRPETKEFNPDSRNGKLMIATTKRILAERNQEILSLIDEMIEEARILENKAIEQLKKDLAMEYADETRDSWLSYRRGLTELKNRLAPTSMSAPDKILLNTTEGEPTIKEGL